MTQPVGALLQFAYVVPDIEKTLKYWTEVLGVGPFFMFERMELVGHKFRGTPTRPNLALALANSGEAQIEIIMQNNDEPSVYKEFADAGGFGLHHVGYTPRNFDAEIAKYEGLGCERALEGSLPGGTRVAYMDTREQLGHLTEFWEETEELMTLFHRVEGASKNWDGSDPVRLL
ncbi:MAG: VOC family protein [Rhodospirillales bacterium]|nr:VOC family protein [Rhodospirillales bacterium]